MNNDKVLVVFSGGQDSTTCLYWAKAHFKEVYALAFIYGQKHVLEVELAEKIAKKAGVHFDKMERKYGKSKNKEDVVGEKTRQT